MGTLLNLWTIDVQLWMHILCVLWEFIKPFFFVTISLFMCKTCLVHLMGFYIGFHFQTKSFDVTFFPSARTLKLVTTWHQTTFHLEFGCKSNFKSRWIALQKLNVMFVILTCVLGKHGLWTLCWKTLWITLISLWSSILSLINVLLM
jgi:hypothetical protein